MLQEIWKKLSESKGNQWLILLLIGILLVVIAIPTNTGTKTDTASGIRDEKEEYVSEMEMRLENLLSQMQGIGKVHVMITYQEGNNVEGVVVVAEGGENAVIVKKINEVIRALFDVDSHKIKVIESK